MSIGTKIIAGIAILSGLILGEEAGKELAEIGKEITKGAEKTFDKIEENIKNGANGLLNGVKDTLGNIGETIEEKGKEAGKVANDFKDFFNGLGDKMTEIKEGNVTIPEETVITETKEETAPNQNNEEENNNKNVLPWVPSQEQEIEDKTSENIESKIENTIDYEKIFAWQEEQQKKLWEREDQIRKEVQDREDSAYQRAVADMRKAGINPNLINVQPAESGGGITQATGMNMELFKQEISKYLGILETELNNSFKGEENQKDRITDTFTTIMQLFSMYMMFQGKKGA